ncbi:exopolysaccharide biosynthesis protein [Emcibacter sp. SYSU 3D8]|uniref:exopolysaccharide biosynthesis protein n=1 Tax=Emcibacter sp. SYSU 3D8 TaxID=3133969 RepID=UPI0031FE9B3A
MSTDPPPDTTEPDSATRAEAGHARPRGPKLSELLTQIAADHPDERISIADITVRLDDRAFGALMFIFAVPNLLPTPPGTSLILGAPLVFLALQLAIGRSSPWLPQLISRRSLLLTDFARIVARVAPVMARAERLMRPRLVLLATRPFDQFMGLTCLLLSVVLFLPIPLGNMPPALAICLFSLALLERDGLVYIAALVTAVLSVVLISGVVYGMIVSLIFLLSDVLGLVKAS